MLPPGFGTAAMVYSNLSTALAYLGTGTVPQAAGRRRRGKGQFVSAQSPRRTSADRSQRCQTALPAALLTRFQSDREGLVEAEAVAPRRQSSHCRGLGTSRRRSPQGHHRRECCRLVSALRLWYTATLAPL